MIQLYHHLVLLPITMKPINIDTDAFSSGQIESKIWAAEELEKICNNENINCLRMIIVGGWYSLLHFILKVRNNVKITYCRSIDLDPASCHISNQINNTWEMKEWEFRSYPLDANQFIFEHENINCVINTSTEHFDSIKWFENIPSGTLVLLQGNNLKHDGEETVITSTIEQFVSCFNLTKTLYCSELELKGKHLPYKRFMIIGYK